MATGRRTTSRRGRLVRRVLMGLVLLVLVGLVGGYLYARPLLRTGTGYAAQNACAVVNVAGRDDPADDLPPNPLVPVLRTNQGDDGAVTAGLFGVLSRQRAWPTDGFGCTLAESPPGLPDPTVVSAAANPFASAPAPTDVDPDVAAAVARAFGDDLPAAEREALGTRAVLVLQDGDLIAERYAEGFDAGTPQLGWSMSKSVTDLLVGRLVQEGRVALDDDRLRPEWDDARAGITVEQLLRMTSGLAWDETYGLGTPVTRMLYDEPDMGDYVASQPAAYEPGTHLQYSSGSTTLLCDVLAERSGMGADLPRQALFAPLGMASAVLEPDAAGTPVCSSYLWASPRDWAAVGQFAIQDGVWGGRRLLPVGWLAESATALDIETQEEEPYGRGWWVNRWPDGRLTWPDLPPDAFAARGHNGQWVLVVPSAGLVVVRMGFSPTLDDVGVTELAADLLPLLD